MINNVEDFLNYKKSESLSLVTDENLDSYSKFYGDLYSYSKEEYDSAMYSLSDKLHKLAVMFDPKTAYKEAHRDSLTNDWNNSHEFAKPKFKGSFDEVQKKRAEWDKGVAKQTGNLRREYERNARRAGVAAGRKAQSNRKNALIAGAVITGIAALGLGALALARKIKSDKDPQKIADEIRALEKKSKEQGGLSKSDAKKLTSLSSKLAKLAVKADPKSARQLEDKADQCAKRAENEVKR